MAGKKRIQSLNQLRGISAILVVFSHIENFRIVFGAACGSFAVCLFFLMSGFLAVLSTANGSKQFLVKKVVKLLPLYYCVTLFTFALALVKSNWFNTTNPTVLNLIRSLLFIPYQNANGLIRPILDVGWYLNVQVLVYILFWSAMKLSHKYRVFIASAVLLILYVLGILFLKDNAFYRLYQDGFIMSAVGMLSFYVYQRIKQNQQVGKNVLFSMVLYGFTVFSGLLYSILKENNLQGFMILLPIIVFTVYLLCDSWVLETKVLNLISVVSLSLYLTHEFTVKGVDRLIIPLDAVTPFKLVVSFLCLIISIGVAYIVYWLIEKKLTGYLLSNITKRDN